MATATTTAFRGGGGGGQYDGSDSENEGVTCYIPWLPTSSSSSPSLPPPTKKINTNNNKNNEKSSSSSSGNDADLAQEMNRLSVAEREKVYDDVHGVATVPEETPDFVVEQYITEFDKAMMKIPTTKKKAYNRAIFLLPKLEHDIQWKLRFLRADEFHAKNAANRMVKYFEQKCLLFGEDKLVKRITIKDFNEDDLKAFESGIIIELPEKDQSGRPIIFDDATKIDWDNVPIESVLRSMWYQWMSASVDEIGQKKGLTCIFHMCGSTLFGPGAVGKITEITMRCGYVASILPFRYSSLHFCYDDPRMNYLVQTFRLASSANARLRLRAHFGSDLENEYSLMTFGIPSEGLLHRSRQKDRTDLKKYIQRRKDEDQRLDDLEAQEEAKTGIILYPRPNDILVGRGKTYREFPGNRIWNRLVDSHTEAYIQSESRFEKTCIAMNVITSVKEYNGRFLQREAGIGWKQMDDIAARKKATDAFQVKAKEASSSLMRIDNNNNNQQQSQSLETPMSSAAKRLRYSPDRDF